MLRTVGLCVIVISGIGCGFAMSNELGRRKKMMEMILRMQNKECAYYHTFLYF